MIRIASVLAFGALLLLAAGRNSLAQSPAQIVKERQDAMEKMWPGYYRDIARTISSGTPDLAMIA
ncbi:MAG: hypothetical protein ACRECA_02110, partial [Pseudolabrys sp.]